MYTTFPCISTRDWSHDLIITRLPFNIISVHVMLKLKLLNTSCMQGILVSGVGYYMQVWVIEKSGPVFLSMTMPITLLVTIMLSSFVLGEAVTVGRCLSFLLPFTPLNC
jgi:drug/metabolite transporter (DMT)-like permease